MQASEQTGGIFDVTCAPLINLWGFGFTKFDSSAGGLGGCPYSPGSTGNISSEELIYMVEEMGCTTGINQPKLAEAGKYAKGLSSVKLKGEFI